MTPFQKPQASLHNCHCHRYHLWEPRPRNPLLEYPSHGPDHRPYLPRPSRQSLDTTLAVQDLPSGSRSYTRWCDNPSGIKSHATSPPSQSPPWIGTVGPQQHYSKSQPAAWQDELGKWWRITGLEIECDLNHYCWQSSNQTRQLFNTV